MKLKKRDDRLVRLGLATGTVAGILSGCMFITPVAHVQAVQTPSNPQTTQLNVDLVPVLSVSLDDEEMNFDLDPSASAVSEESTGVLVSTNADKGYTLYITTNSDETALTSSAETVTTQIPTLTESVEKDDFPVNNWGYYNMASSEYAPVPASGARTAIVNQTDEPAWYEEGTSAAEAAKFDLTIGARVNYNVTAGEYSNTVVLTAVAND